MHEFTKVRDGEEVFVKLTPENPLGYSNRQLACVGLPCPYCGEKFEYVPDGNARMPTRDHFFAKSTHKHLYKSGTSSLSTVMVCNACNQAKKNHTFERFVSRNQHSNRKNRLNLLLKSIKDGTVRVATFMENKGFREARGDPRGFIGLSMVEFYEFGSRA